MDIGECIPALRSQNRSGARKLVISQDRSGDCFAQTLGS